MGLGTKEHTRTCTHTYRHTRDAEEGCESTVSPTSNSILWVSEHDGCRRELVELRKGNPHSLPRMSALIRYVVLQTPNPVY